MDDAAKLKIIYIYIIIQPLLDLVTSLMTKFNFPLTLGIVVRGGTLLVCGYYILFCSKSKYNKISKIYLLILLIYFFGYFFTKLSIFSNISTLINETSYLFKYFYIVLVFIFSLNFFDEHKPDYNKLIVILLINLLIYCFIIVFANITNTAFATYLHGGGNTGWFFSGNEISNLLVLIFPLIFLAINKIPSFVNLLIIIPIIYAISVIGTKTSFLGLLFPTLLVLLYNLIKIKKFNYRIVIINTIILILVTIFSFNLSIFDNVKNSISLHKTNVTHNDIKDNDVKGNIKGNDVKGNIKGNDVKENIKDKIIIDVILSNRDTFNENIKKLYNSSNLPIKLFGIGFSKISEKNEYNIEKLIEMDFFDIYYRYGIIGFTLYFLPILIFTLYIMKLLIFINYKLTLNQLILGYSSYIGFALGIIVGHTLGAPGVSTYIVLLLMILIHYLKYEDHGELEGKISFLALHMGHGGVERAIANQANMLCEKYEVEIIILYKVIDEIPYELNNKIKLIYLSDLKPNKQEFLNSLNDKKIFKAFIEGIKSVYILLMKKLLISLYIHNSKSKIIISTRLEFTKLLIKYGNENTIRITEEHTFHANNSKYLKAIGRTLKNIDYILPTSRYITDDYKRFFSDYKDKIVYIPNIINKIPKKLNNCNNKNIITVARFSKEKGLKDLLEVFELVNQKAESINLIIVGDGPERKELEKIINSKKLCNIKLTGFLNEKALLKAYQKASLFVMTSFEESFGLVLIESMSYGIPCIAFDSALGAREIINKKNGILIKNRDKERMANEIISYFSKGVSDKMMHEARNTALKYSFDQVKIIWNKFIAEILDEEIGKIESKIIKTQKK